MLSIATLVIVDFVVFLGSVVLLTIACLPLMDSQAHGYKTPPLYQRNAPTKPTSWLDRKLVPPPADKKAK